MSITYTRTLWSDIHRVMTKIMDAVEGEEDTTAVMACLTLAVRCQLEDCTMDELKAGVKGASEWIALYASSIDKDAPIERAN